MSVLVWHIDMLVTICGMSTANTVNTPTVKNSRRAVLVVRGNNGWGGGGGVVGEGILRLCTYNQGKRKEGVVGHQSWE